jgi:hypothetical protein
MWLQFWKKASSGAIHIFNHYVWCDEATKESIKERLEMWAESMPGGSEHRCKFGYMILKRPPPRKWIEDEIKRVRDRIKEDQKHLSFLLGIK